MSKFSSWWRLFLVLVLAFCPLSTGRKCPPLCLCHETTVRCMHAPPFSITDLVDNGTVKLDLRNTKLRKLDPYTFSNLKNLTILLLDHNHLTVLCNYSFSGLDKLRVLHLFKNRLRDIDVEAFVGLRRLQHLYLQFNQLTYLKHESFKYLSSLERLFLQNNKINNIPSEIFYFLSHLSKLRLDRNPIVCDCSMLWLIKMANENYHHNKNMDIALICNQPQDVHGMSIKSITLENLHCKKPYIQHGPNDVEILIGEENVMFDCQATGDPTPSVYWMKDYVEVPLSNPKYNMFNNGSLMIEYPDESDMGVIECMAKNSLGQAKSKRAKINVKRDIIKGSFVFLHQPQDKIVKLNGVVNLDCVVNGNPKPHISWYRNDEKILLTENINLFRNGTLQIKNFKSSDAGLYTCEASNYLSYKAITANISIIQPPILNIKTEPVNYHEGDQLEISCNVQGTSSPIEWYKDDEELLASQKINIDQHKITISQIDEFDNGQYVCQVRHSDELYSESVEIVVQPKVLLLPEIIIKPYDQEIVPGSKIELPCNSDTSGVSNTIWKKDGSKIIMTNRHKLSRSGSLHITNVTENDSGRYECSVINENGRTTASAYIKVTKDFIQKPGDEFVNIAFAEAVLEVDAAISKTVESLFGNNRDKKPNVADLYRLVRFPSAPERQLARAAEIYERTLINIRRRLDVGKMVNVTTNFNYNQFLSSDHIDLIAKLSGCIGHRLVPDCNNTCFHLKYRTIDGTCNNQENPTWGASNTGFRRILDPIYENGFNQPVGWNKEIKYNGHSLPSARLVSSRVISTANVTLDDTLSHMVMQWGQFLDHDLDHATPSVSSQSWDGVDCKRTCEYAAPCFPIDVPENDPRITNRRCIDFTRSSSVCGSGITSVFFDKIQPREQINQLTSFIDASQVYGYSESVAQDLRNLTSDDGLLRNGVTYPDRKPLLPFSSSIQEMDCRRGALENDVKCFVAGDIRANEQVGLLSMHTLWYREHNRIATKLKLINPHWNGDRIYHEARKVVGAQMQHITYDHWLPLILGRSGIEKLQSMDSSYNPRMNPSISNVFATAALRFGHSLINPVLQRLNENYEEIPEGNLLLHEAFFASWRVAEEGGIDPLLRGLYMSPSKLKTPTQNLNEELTEKLFHVAHAVALDLAAMNIQRSRDHAIPPYTKWRQYCNLTRIDSFEDLKTEISDVNVRKLLKDIYGSVHNIDVWVGGILEDQLEGAKVGPLFSCLLIDQFYRLKVGDRFWYEHPYMFKSEQLKQIKKSTLARVLCDNGDHIDTVSENVFLLPEKQDGLIDCEDVDSMDLNAWTDCNDCEGGFCFSESQALNVARSRRSSYIVEKPFDEEYYLKHFMKMTDVVNTLKKQMKHLKSKVEKWENKCNNKK